MTPMATIHAADPDDITTKPTSEHISATYPMRSAQTANLHDGKPRSVASSVTPRIVPPKSHPDHSRSRRIDRRTAVRWHTWSVTVVYRDVEPRRRESRSAHCSCDCVVGRRGRARTARIAASKDRARLQLQRRDGSTRPRHAVPDRTCCCWHTRPKKDQAVGSTEDQSDS